LRAGEPPEPNVNHWVTREGALRLISWLDACFFDERGSLTHIVSTGIDITDERRADDALRGIEAVGTLLARQGPTRESMAAILQTLADGMGYPYLALFLREGDTIRLGAQLGYRDLADVFDPAGGIIGRCLRTGEAALVPDVSVDPDYVVGHADVTSEIAVPLSAEGQTLGVLSIESTIETPLTEADLRLAQTIAERLSVALVLGREQQATAERARLFAALIGFARVANSTLDAERLMPSLADAIGEVLAADALGVVALDRTSGRYLLQAVRGGLDARAVGAEIQVGQGISGRAMASRALVFDRVDRSGYAAGRSSGPTERISRQRSRPAAPCSTMLSRLVRRCFERPTSGCSWPNGRVATRSSPSDSATRRGDPDGRHSRRPLTLGRMMSATAGRPVWARSPSITR
jgi:GAF domain-containing protein